MKKYNLYFTNRRWPKLLVGGVLTTMLLVAGAVATVRYVYHQNLKPLSNVQTTRVVTVPLGSSARAIADLLKREKLIRSDWAFEWYVGSQEVREKLQAGTYALRPSQSVPEIVTILTQGKIDTKLVTILPGKRLDEIRNSLINYGFSATDVDEALKSETYQNHPALVEKPAGTSLEGYLYPESFQKDASTKPQTIIRQSLDEMQKRLTPEVRNGIVGQGLKVYEGIILASIIEKEVSHPEDKAQVAQVYLRRLRSGMALEADPTSLYGAILANEPPTVGYDSVYNTYKHPGLPPTPISNVSESSLQAVIKPAQTDWLFFVSGDDCRTYFSHTLQEHKALTAQHLKKGCGSQ